MKNRSTIDQLHPFKPNETAVSSEVHEAMPAHTGSFVGASSKGFG
jgi:hypothetical protein